MFVVNRTQRQTRRAQVGGADDRTQEQLTKNILLKRPTAKTRKQQQNLQKNVAEWQRRFPDQPVPGAAPAPAPAAAVPQPAGPPYMTPECPRGKLQGGPAAACDGWYVVPEERAAQWRTKFPDMPTCWANRNVEPTPPSADLIRDYLQCIMRIDELRQAALDFTYAKYDIDPATTAGPARVTKLLENAASIQADTTLRAYLEDVEFLISFPQKNMQQLLSMTKEKLLREQPLRNMIYPWRLSNLQIKLLADNFAYLKAAPADINRLMALYAREDKTAYTTALEITAGHLMSEAYELSYKLTGEEPIDGLFMYQHVEDFKKTFKTFYSTFLQAVVEKLNAFNPATCKDLFYTTGDAFATTSARAAAAIFLLYKQTDAWSHTLLLEQFKDPEGKECDRPIHPQLTDSVPYLPLKDAWSALVVEGLTFGSLVNQMNPNLMQFVLQLAYRLEKPKAGGPTKKQEIAA